VKLKIGISLTIILILALSIWGYLIWDRSYNEGNNGSFYEVSNALGVADTAGFKKAVNIRTFHFPEDNGPHPAYKNEWWYYTGNIHASNGRHFGFQFTLFRVGLKPGNASSISDWATHQFYMGHLALTDVENKKFYAYQRFSRSAMGLAGAKSTPFHIWLDDWQVTGDTARIPVMHIKAGDGNIALDLHIESEKPPVLQGNYGLSQKGSTPGNASYYYSLTRLKTNGRIRINQKTYNVTGLSWMDREWGTSMLESDQSGWDWFSIQLNNSWDLMYYQIRRKNGQPDTTSGGKLIKSDGSSINLPYGSVEINVRDHWKSPDTNTEYPSLWTIKIPAHNITLYIDPYIHDQELKLSVKYWEGAVKVNGNMDGNDVKGNGYVELTGYGENKTMLSGK
jgi:predicted secreted hydrolase